MQSWKDMLIKIEKIEANYGSKLRRPASELEISEMKENIKQKWSHINIPNSYVELLNHVNGLDFNGLVIYGVDKVLLEKEIEEDVHGFIETNEYWYENEWQKQYVFFGDSDTAWYCYDMKENQYVELDNPSGTLIQKYEGFRNMLDDALNTALS
ncbi:YrhA family protein [Sutcliffiella horikoshii]|uniref:YrhA family protein n=1 Tax=Sutcliffiella horikoshii TaxID=79883 RepID=UPI00384E6542